MAIRINPVVAKTSPSIYAAAQSAGLPQDQVNQLEQFSFAVQKNKELNQLRIEDARKRFNELDPDAQAQLKFLFPKADYQLAPPDISDYAVGALKTGATALASPLIMLFKAAGAWNRIINTPYLVARQALQGEGLFTKQTWTDAWDGRRVYNQSSLDEAISQFGIENVEVAKGLLAGKKPGEIISTYNGGKPDQAILRAIETAFNDPDKFQNILDTVEYAKVSPGRDIGRLTGIKGISRYVDFTYQIVIDPLTWATGGLSTLAKIPLAGKLVKPNTTGTQMVQTIEKFGTSGVKQIFQDNPGVRQLWDNELGPRIKDYASANSVAEKTAIARDIRTRFPGYNNDEAIKMLEENQIFDADKAQRYFSKAEEVKIKSKKTSVEKHGDLFQKTKKWK